MKKKLIVAIVALVVVLGGGIGGYVYHTNQVKAEKAAMLARYKSALADYRNQSNRLMYGLDFVASDFIINWKSAITNKKAMDASNKIVPCSNFEDAVSARYAFYDKYGAYKIIDEAYKKLGSVLDKVKLNSANSDKETIKLCSDNYDELNNAILLVKKPNGTLMRYSSKKGEVFFKLYVLDGKLAKKAPLEEDRADERTKSTYMQTEGGGFFVTADWEKEPQKAKRQVYTFGDISNNWVYLD